MIGLDTNVLVYAANEDAPQHDVCRALIEGIDSDGRQGDLEPLCLTWSVVYEFLRVITHRSVLDHPFSIDHAWATVASLLDLPHVQILGPGPQHADHAMRMLAAPGVNGNLVFDAHVAAVLAEHGVRRVYTFDQDFHRFPGVEVVNPLG